MRYQLFTNRLFSRGNFENSNQILQPGNFRRKRKNIFFQAETKEVFRCCQFHPHPSHFPRQRNQHRQTQCHHRRPRDQS